MEDPITSGSSDRFRGFRKPRCQKEGSGNVTNPLVVFFKGAEHVHPPSEDFNVLISDSESELKRYVTTAACSVMEHSMLSMNLISHSQKGARYGSSKEDVATFGVESLDFGSSISPSDSEVLFRGHPTGFDIASQGLGTQFERSSPISCSPDSLTPLIKDEAGYRLAGVTRALGRLLSWLLNISG